MKNASLLLLLLLLPLKGFNQELKLDQIMAGNEFIGHQPDDVVWSPDSREIYFRWQHNNETVARYYAYSFQSQSYRKLSGAEQLYKAVNGFYSKKQNFALLFEKRFATFHRRSGHKRPQAYLCQAHQLFGV